MLSQRELTGEQMDRYALLLQRSEAELITRAQSSQDDSE
jgi:hypothetical protein